MIQGTTSWTARPFYRYLLVGGSVYVLELGVILLAQQAGASSVVAVGIAFWTGLIVSFVLQKFVTFSDKRTHTRVLAKQFLAVSALVLWNFAFTLAVTKLLSSHLPPTVTRTIALLITTLWNFYLYKTSIFRQPDNPIY
jgi:putative flippase GtrA